MHAPLPPSSAARIVACYGSANMEDLYPQEDTIDTQEGDAAHWGGAELLRGQQIAVGQVAPNGIVLNSEMVEAAEGYMSYIMSRDNGAWIDGVTPSVESTVIVTPLHVNNWGTPDYAMYDNRFHTLFIDDFKYGHGFVSEIGCWQLINYAALKAAELGLYHDDTLSVTMTIHQPRCFHRRGQVRSWTATLGELRPYFQQLKTAFFMASQVDAMVTVNDPDACRNCSARVYCEANLLEAGHAVDLAYASIPLGLTPMAMARELRKLTRAEKVLKSRREGLEEAITRSIVRGKPVPFYSIGHEKGRLTWDPSAVENGVLTVAAAYNVKVEKPGMITPLQAIKAGIPEDVVKMYSSKKGGAQVLIEDDGTAAEKIFTKE